MDEASERNAEVVCISSGGQLREEAATKGHKHINIPNLALARASLPYLIMPGLKLINPLLENSLEQPSLPALLPSGRRFSSRPRSRNSTKYFVNYLIKKKKIELGLDLKHGYVKVSSCWFWCF